MIQVKKITFKGGGASTVFRHRIFEGVIQLRRPRTIRGGSKKSSFLTDVFNGWCHK